jgi:D-glycero-alpha-D-manno-heptose-7-phosphate kinase
VIKVPAGMQDYYPAFYGSVSCIHLDPDGVDREHLAIDHDEIKRRFIICYTGEPRHSGINNWEVFKRHIDGDADVFAIFEHIREAAIGVRTALLANDWQAVAETMRAAYPNRKRLAPGITTPQMDHLVEQALANGAEAAKVCGAGCIAFLCADGRKQDIEHALKEAGAEILDWEVSLEGLEVKKS